PDAVDGRAHVVLVGNRRFPDRPALRRHGVIQLARRLDPIGMDLRRVSWDCPCDVGPKGSKVPKLRAPLDIPLTGIGPEGVIARRAKGLFLRGGNASVVVIVVLSREQHCRAEQRRNQRPVTVAARAPDEEADIAQRSAGSSARLGDLGIALPELRGELRIGLAVLVLEAAEERGKLDLFDGLPAPATRRRHGGPRTRGWPGRSLALVLEGYRDHRN